VKQRLRFPHFFLRVGSRRKVASPVVHGVVSIREHVVVLNRPGDVLRVQGIDVGTWSRVEDMDVLVIVVVEVFYDGIHLIEVHPCICERKVTAKWDEQMISEIVSLHLNDVVQEIVGLTLRVVVLESWICDKGIIVEPSLIIGKSWRPAIVVSHYCSEYFLLIAKVF